VSHCCCSMQRPLHVRPHTSLFFLRSSSSFAWISVSSRLLSISSALVKWSSSSCRDVQAGRLQQQMQRGCED
jgi:hypothetical protein